MKFIDLFAGVGGFRLGMERAGHECVWSCEIDRWCEYVYKKRFGSAYDWKDATTVNAGLIPDHDILCAGFPCQAFSIAGKRKGFLDPRGTLFGEILRIARTKRSQYLFLENVPGILSHDQGRTFATILNSLSQAGFCVQWQVLNSKWFGVPQNRERVFIIGYFGKGCPSEVFPFRQDDPVPCEAQEGNGKEGLRVRGEHNCRSLGTGDNSLESNLIAHTIQSRYYKDGKEQLVQVGTLGKDAQHSRVYDSNGMAKTISDGGGQGAKTGLYVVDELKYGDHIESIHDPKGIARTLKGIGLQEGMKIRRLTPKECERLQGFPDQWTEIGINEKGEEVEISDSQRYRMMGNAVTVNVIEAIARRAFRGEA